eukprot:m51a1_g4240 putative ubiquitin carboxylterminal hydrolase (1020) ;mRNA; r:156475-159972
MAEPHPDERAAAKQILQAEGAIVPRRSFMLVNYKWWQLWCAHVCYDELPADTPGPRPGPIDNTELLEPQPADSRDRDPQISQISQISREDLPSTPDREPGTPAAEGSPGAEVKIKSPWGGASGLQMIAGGREMWEFLPNVVRPGSLQLGRRLRQGLVLNVDYIPVPESLWKLFVDWYGGGPEIRRPVVQTGLSMTARLELYPVHVEVETKTGDMGGCRDGVRRTMWYTFSPSQTLKEVRQYLSFAMDAAPHHLLLWLAGPGGAEHELAREQLPRTLEDVGIADGAKVLVGKKTPLLSVDAGRALAASSAACSPVWVAPRPAASVRGTPDVMGNVGLANLGCTCYMASALQCLSHTLPLARFYLGGGGGGGGGARGRDGALVTGRFAALLRRLWGGQYVSVVPREFKSAFCMFAPHFAGSGQQDAHEFLLLALEALHSELAPSPRAAPPVASGSREEAELRAQFEGQLARDCSAVTETFRGRQRNSVRCLRCGSLSVNYEPFLCLSVPVPCDPNRPVSVLLVPADRAPVQMTVSVPKSADAAALRRRVAEAAACADVVLAEVYGSRAFELKDAKPVSDIRSNDRVVAYALPRGPACRPVLVSHRAAGELRAVATPLYVQFASGARGREVCAAIRERVALFLGIDAGLVPRFAVYAVVDPRERGWPLGDDDALGAQAASLCCEWPEEAIERLRMREAWGWGRWDDQCRGNAAAPSPSSAGEMTCRLEECLEAYGSEEAVHWRCTVCGGSEAIRKASVLSPLPDVVVVHLKRFRCEGAYREKVRTNVLVSMEEGLDMSVLTRSPEPEFYDLYAVAKHSGGLNSGHYTAAALGIDGKWYSFDDTSVTPVAPGRASEIASEAYLLFFQRRLPEGASTRVESLWEVLPDVMSESFAEEEASGSLDAGSKPTEAMSVTSDDQSLGRRWQSPLSKDDVENDVAAQMDRARESVNAILGAALMQAEAVPNCRSDSCSGIDLLRDETGRPASDPCNEELHVECPFCQHRFKDEDTALIHIMTSHPEGHS